jgi:predicted metal-dependent hydrolase
MERDQVHQTKQSDVRLQCMRMQMMTKTTRKIKNKPTVESAASYVLDGVPINYTLHYKSVKNFNLRVRDGRSFTLSVPHRTPQRLIQRFLDDHVDFLRKALHSQNEHQRPWHRSLYEQALSDGTELCLLDQRVLLHIVSGNVKNEKPALKVTRASEDTEIWQITVGNYKSEQERDQIIQKLVISEEIRRLEQAVTACIPAIAQKVMLAAENLGISEEMSADYPYMKFVTKPTAIRFRDMRSRWGSCTVQKGHICINYRLTFAPASCLHYVLGHELCHFIYPNHSASFYRLLNAAIPDAMEARNILQGK